MSGMHGFNGYKQVVGRKRHILVYTENFLLSAVVHPANFSLHEGRLLVLDTVGASFPRLQRIWSN